MYTVYYTFRELSVNFVSFIRMEIRDNIVSDAKANATLQTAVHVALGCGVNV